MKVRQDAWTHEDDLLLAETVLRHVREGSTQLNAFEEVGDKLNRTSAACGFRWNAVVRHNYEKALQLAKKQRKQRNRLLGKDQGGKKKLLYTPPTPTVLEVGLLPEPKELLSSTNAVEPETTVTYEQIPTAVSAATTVSSLEDVIEFLQSMNKESLHSEALHSENTRLKAELVEAKNEISRLKQMKDELEHKIENLEENTETIQEDYETIMKIMNRARKLVLLEEDAPHATKFKMDRNGNLEKVAE
ncbi:RsfA family transcriptional regulator [Bacillus sp. AGMB 02131]|uniref:RsfA family transcriptional regulator n=1 Tax=Peribacillus faecalis TaxID=2772559 RepID=A0A927CUP0_9BACI|nr:RsfA family transcriptional regulator [Peribacillus faecalis]MBD3107052.1 RsfA family transcriptional regulator [Peribacillus faecalis]